jgi:hypothetical protein
MTETVVWQIFKPSGLMIALAYQGEFNTKMGAIEYLRDNKIEGEFMIYPIHRLTK